MIFTKCVSLKNWTGHARECLMKLHSHVSTYAKLLDWSMMGERCSIILEMASIQYYKSEDVYDITQVEKHLLFVKVITLFEVSSPSI